MHRATLLKVLAEHPSADAQEAADVAFITRFAEAHADCFGKTNPLGHITASTFVLDPAGRVLMTHHRKLGRWLQLGGHSDPDEHDPADTALREATEESGLPDLELRSRAPLDVDVHRIPARKGEPAHDHLDLRYVARTRVPERLVLSDESHALRWFERAALVELDLDPALRRAIGKLPPE